MTHFKKLAITSLFTALIAVTGIAKATVVESFANGQLTTPGWSVGIGADASSFLYPAPDGTTGIYLSESTWSVNSNIDFHQGEVLTAWINPGPSADVLPGSQGGRVSIGFESGATTTYALTAASDSNQLLFQSVTGINSVVPTFTDGVSSTTSYADQWYKLAISWQASGITGSLYDQDGTTLLSSVSTTLPATGNTGIALFGNGGAAITSLSVEPVPEAQQFAMMLAGLALMGAMVRRRAR